MSSQHILKFIFVRFSFVIISLMFVTGFYYSAKDLMPIANAYPIGIIAFLVIIIAWTIGANIISFIKKEGVEFQEKKIIDFVKEWRKPLYMVSMLVFYISTISYLGFYTTSTLFLVILFYLLNFKEIMMPIVVTVIILSGYVIFSIFLQVRLPSGLLI